MGSYISDHKQHKLTWLDDKFSKKVNVVEEIWPLAKLFL